MHSFRFLVNHRFSWLAASTLLLVFLFSGSGCADQAGQARQSMEKGDAEISSCQIASSALVDSIDAFIVDIDTSLTEGSGPDPETVRERASAVKSAASEFAAALDRSRSEFERILDLEGVDDYKAYADAMLGLIGVSRDGILDIGDYVDCTLSSVESGDFHATDWFKATGEIQKKMEELALETSNLEAQANSIKSDMGLD